MHWMLQYERMWWMREKLVLCSQGRMPARCEEETLPCCMWVNTDYHDRNRDSGSEANDSHDSDPAKLVAAITA